MDNDPRTANEVIAEKIASRRQFILDLLSERIQSGKYDHVRRRAVGVRSRQVAALIDILVEKGLL